MGREANQPSTDETNVELLLITCPNCQREIDLTEVIDPLLTCMRTHYEEKLSQRDLEVAHREKQLIKEQEAFRNFKRSIDQEVARRIDDQRAIIAAQESERARRLLGNDLMTQARELQLLQELLADRETRLADAQQTQADFLRQQRELEVAKRELELTIEKEVQQSLLSVRDDARREADEAYRLRVAEKEQQITGMRQQIDELKQKAEQGSEQRHGEVLELELETLLRSSFPNDAFDSVPTGIHGADLVHSVMSSSGYCGTIIWEAKRTKRWSDAWLTKLRDDQRAAQADMAIIVSQTLPRDVDTFRLIDGIWVTSYRCVIPLAMTLRHSIIELARTRQAQEGLRSKMEQVYRYLTGPQFRSHVLAISEKFAAMREDLDLERRTMMRLWAKRERQILSVLAATSGIEGDLEGIAGQSLEEIEGIEPILLSESPSELRGASMNESSGLTET
ncbi:DUF2130 domain-containing protein [bacterium]|nr:DUF2130 domain-containing protein [bacterium]